MIARLLMLAAFVALIAALVQWRVVEREPAAATADEERPGYFMTGVDLEEFGADGRLRIGLQSISAKQDPASGVVRLSDVAVLYQAPEGQAWNLTSNEAQTVTVGALSFLGGDRPKYNLTAAAALVSVVPPLLLALTIQRYLVRGLSFGAVKS